MSESREGRTRKLARPEYAKLGELIASRLEEMEMSQRALGRALGVSTSYANKIVLGRRTIELTEFLDLCEVLRLEPSRVISEVGARKN